jgi:hypothetical protein
MHLVLTVCTAGLWLISWVAVCIGNYIRPWRCEHCGWQKPEFGEDHSLIRPAKRLAASRLRAESRPPPIIGARSTHLQP